MSELIRVFVVCVLEPDRHTPTSVLTKCDICKKGVWIQPFNLVPDKTPVCIPCAMLLPNPQFGVDRRSVEAAFEEIKRRKAAGECPNM